jgi:hypothetical protein
MCALVNIWSILYVLLLLLQQELLVETGLQQVFGIEHINWLGTVSQNAGQVSLAVHLLLEPTPQAHSAEIVATAN